ncbi:ABC transporter permease [Extibacter muris]|uniref:ABC transporter permease n=1 Tax=Extibacter muris TaxID=1796622 RepID=UPI001D06DBC1|nr:ABC transporter permease [Extibacter muris]MCB6201728.1 ABC transporter permease [Extibacter muris]MCQ4663519.1 ABC transporter permease [Extibacter muris]MCQ4693502.1 ABC transporter permease [Extibacter muris]
MDRERREGRLGQTKVYVGKFFRIFKNEKDWKGIVFAVIVTLLLSLVLGDTMFLKKEGTRSGFFAIVSAGIWIGIFNSIQTVCRERQIIKREHRTGLHMSAYVGAHVICQGIICAVQALLMTFIYGLFMDFPDKGLVTGSFYADFYITMLLILFSSDMLGLAVSSLVKSTTAAMTVMPFLLIIQLIFSGSIFPITGNARIISDLTVSKWGQRVLCIESDMNEIPSELLDSEIEMFESIEGVEELMDLLPDKLTDDIHTAVERFLHDYTYRRIYEYKAELVYRRWGYLLAFAAAYALIAAISLEFIDRDKR